MIGVTIAELTAPAAGHVPGVGGTLVTVLAHQVGQTLALPVSQVTVTVAR